MSEPEQDPNEWPEDKQIHLTDKLQNFIENLLRQDFVEVDLEEVVAREITHRMLERALAGGVAPHQVSESLEFNLQQEAPGLFSIEPRNMFTMLLVLGIARDPEILQALTVRTEQPVGGWTDEFTDERGGFRLQFTPPNTFIGIIKANEGHPVSWIDLTLDLPGESE